MGNSATKRRSSYAKIIGGLAVSLFCLWWILRFIDLSKLLEVLQASNGLFIALAMIVMLSSYAFRSIRWPYFFSNNAPDLQTSFRCLIVGFFMNNVLPARIGELVRAHIGGRATSQSRALVLATIAGERLVDGLTISLFFALLFSYSQSATVPAEQLTAAQPGVSASMAVIPKSEITESTFAVPASIAEASNVEYGQAMYLVAYLFLFAGIATMLVLVARHRIFALLERLSNVMPGHLSRYTLRRVRLFIEGLEPMFDRRKLPFIVFFSLLVWSIELTVFYLISLAFNQPMNIGALSLFLAVVNFSSLIPAAPGGIGVIELLATMALTGIGIDAEVAFAMVLSQHVIQLLVVGVPGAYFFFSMLGGKVPSAEEDPDPADSANGDEEAYADVSEPATKDAVSAFCAEDVSEDSASELVDISVIIPAYNEEDRLPKTLLSVLEYFREREETFEVIVVDDGSVDNTAAVVRQTAALAPQLRLLSCPGNRGKGYAVRLGVLKSKGRIILFDDADGSTPIEEIERLLKAIHTGAHVAIGSRALFSRETQVDTNWHRKYLGRVFNGVVNILALPGIADTQCGFKMFVRPIARYAFAKQKAERFSFDVEVLFLARKTGCKIIEVPVNWHHVPGSKINLVMDASHMLIDVITVRFRHLMGGYGERVSIAELMGKG